MKEESKINNRQKFSWVKQNKNTTFILNTKHRLKFVQVSNKNQPTEANSLTWENAKWMWLLQPEIIFTPTYKGLIDLFALCHIKLYHTKEKVTVFDDIQESVPQSTFDIKIL